MTQFERLVLQLLTAILRAVMASGAWGTETGPYRNASAVCREADDAVSRGFPEPGDNGDERSF